MYIHMVKFSGAQQFFFSIYWFQMKQLTSSLLEFIKVYKQNPLENCFIFTIYHLYLALIHRLVLYIANFLLTSIQKTFLHVQFVVDNYEIRRSHIIVRG